MTPHARPSPARRFEPPPPTRPDPSKDEEYGWRCPGCATCQREPLARLLLAAAGLVALAMFFLWLLPGLAS